MLIILIAVEYQRKSLKDVNHSTPQWDHGRTPVQVTKIVTYTGL